MTPTTIHDLILKNFSPIHHRVRFSVNAHGTKSTHECYPAKPSDRRMGIADCIIANVNSHQRLPVRHMADPVLEHSKHWEDVVLLESFQIVDPVIDKFYFEDVTEHPATLMECRPMANTKKTGLVQMRNVNTGDELTISLARVEDAIIHRDWTSFVIFGKTNTPVVGVDTFEFMDDKGNLRLCRPSSCGKVSTTKLPLGTSITTTTSVNIANQRIASGQWHGFKLLFPTGMNITKAYETLIAARNAISHHGHPYTDNIKALLK